MLNTTKTLTINGTSTTEEGEPIASMFCTIEANGMTSENSCIINNVLYEKNKDLVRADMDAFTVLCREEEDKFLNENKEAGTETV